MELLLVSATAFEIAPTIEFLKLNFHSRSEAEFQKSNLNVKVIITGVGMPLTCFALGNLFAKFKFDYVINVGVAGALRNSFKIGDVVNVISETFGDLGAETAEESFLSLADMGLVETTQFPYENGELLNNDVSQAAFLPTAKGLTVNKVHGADRTIKMALERFPNAEVESMEGAGFFLSCLLAEIPFLSIRGISNQVTKRDKEAWNLPLAIENVNTVLVDILKTIVSAII